MHYTFSHVVFVKNREIVEYRCVLHRLTGELRRVPAQITWTSTPRRWLELLAPLAEVVPDALAHRVFRAHKVWASLA